MDYLQEHWHNWSASQTCGLQIAGASSEEKIGETWTKDTETSTPCIPWNNFSLDNNSTAEQGIEYLIPWSVANGIISEKWKDYVLKA